MNSPRSLTSPHGHGTHLCLVLLLLLFVASVTTVWAQTGSVQVGATIGPAAPYFTDDVTATVTVAASAGAPPTGSVVGASDGGSQQTVALANGVARLDLAFFAPGPHSFVYSYSGDSTYAATSPQTLSFTVADRPFAMVGGEHFFLYGQGNHYTVAVDSKNNVYLPNPATNAIDKADPSGVITTFPSSGLSGPDGIAIDTSDNVFVADSGNQRIVEIAQGGSQSTLPITGLLRPVSITFDPAFQSLYIIDQGNSTIVVYNLATQTQTSIAPGPFPLNGIAVDAAGNIYYSQGATLGDSGHVVRRDSSGNTTTLFTGVLNPQALLLDRQGNLYISSNGVFVLDPQSHLTQISGATVFGGVVSGDLLTGSMTIDSRGRLYLPNVTTDVFVPGAAGNAGPAATYNDAVSLGVPTPYEYPDDVSLFYQVPYQKTISSFTTPAGSPLFTSRNHPPVPLASPASVPFVYEIPLFSSPIDPGPYATYGTVTTSDGNQNNVLIYGTGFAPVLAISPGTITPQTLQISAIGGVAEDLTGSIYVSDPGSNTVLKVSGSATTTIPFTGLHQPTQLALDGLGAVYVLDSGSSRILRVDTQGTQAVVFDLSTQQSLTSLSAFAIDGGANLYLAGNAAAGQAAIYVLDNLGKQTLLAGNIALPAAMAVDNFGSLYSVTSASGVLLHFGSAGDATQIASGLEQPASVAIDASGTAYVTGAKGSGITIVSPDGTKTPYPADLLPADSIANASVVAINPDGSASLVVGDSTGKQIISILRGGNPFDHFGAVPVGASATIHGLLSNAGNLTLPPFAIIPSSGSFTWATGSNECIEAAPVTNPALPPANACNLTLTFSPTYVGDITQGFAIGNGGGLTAEGTGVAAAATGTPSLVLTPASLTFPGTAQGSSSAAQTLTLTNNGTAAANITSITLAGADASSFAMQSGCGATLASSASCVLSITFAPIAANRSFSGSVLVASNDPRTPAVAMLSGSSPAAAPASPTAALTPAAVNFGAVTTGQSATQTLTLTNTGTVSLTINSTGSLTAPFTISGTTCTGTLAAGTTCTYAVVFAPIGAIASNASFSVTDSAGTQTSTLTGTGAAASPAPAPQAALTPATAIFSSLTVGTTSTAQSFTLTNAGSAPLPISSITLTGENASSFTLGQNTCGETLAAGGSCAVAVTFSPTDAGSFAATLSVTDAVGIQTSALTGTGAPSATPPDFTIAATPVAQTSARGATVTYTVQLTSANAANPFASAVQLSAGGLPDGASAGFSPGSVVPGTTQPATSSLTVTVPALSAGNDPSPAPWLPSGAVPAGASLASLGCVWLLRKKARAVPRLLSVLLCVGLAGVAASLAGCGSSTTGFALPHSTSTITVTGTSGSITHTTSVTLTVQ